MNDDDDRRIILARRQRLLASALAGLALGGSCARPLARPCLSVVPVPGRDEDAAVVASPDVPARAAGDLVVEDAARSVDDASMLPEVIPPPRPCLSVAPPRDAAVDLPRPPRMPPAPERPSPVSPPMPCLSIARPQEMLLRKPTKP